MESSPTSELLFVDGDGSLVSEPEEWALAHVIVPVEPESLAEVDVLRNGQPLEISARLIADRVRVTADWTRAGAGTYELRAQLSDGTRVASTTCFVAPRKLSSTAVDRMLDDLQQLPA